MTEAFDEMFVESEVPKEKRVKLASAIEGLMPNIVDHAIEKSDVRWEARMEELMQKYMAKVDENIRAAETRNEAKFAELLRRLEIVEKDSKALKSSMSSAGSVVGSGVSAVPSQTDREFIPRKVEVV